MSLGGFLAGLLLGGLTGAIAAFLGSPRTGREKLDSLAEAVPNLRDQGQATFDRAADDLKARIERSVDAFRKGEADTRERMLRELDRERHGQSNS